MQFVLIMLKIWKNIASQITCDLAFLLKQKNVYISMSWERGFTQNAT